MSGGMTRKPGDWVCRSCQYVNFCRRDSCQRCGELKVGVQLERADYSSISGSWDVKPGDWYCAACGVHNYASRPSCFKCSASKDDSASVIANSWGFRCNSPGGAANWSSSWKSGDWICSRLGCNEHNYASRTECFRCNAPRSDCGSGY
ncbi:zinc finger Ran-binding domain-containing protein 2-like [Zingiber officinale]|uniref:zinc finger Ran-binding domain-containing protein 2-like n=1 Tax=Zingiber officinale TaxID=94328 RepID=UPI001C4CFC98|nr:zinc finger Ran-binding domain-containing protein 2-like [Zingiber officinale]